MNDTQTPTPPIHTMSPAQMRLIRQEQAQQEQARALALWTRPGYDTFYEQKNNELHGIYGGHYHG